MPDITVLTPTYNRKERLKELYCSLRVQSNKDFIWLIIDDGSTDDTEQEVYSWIKQADYPIVYLKKENGGKHTALNFAYQHITTPLTFIVDSDDTLTPNAIEVVERKYLVYRAEGDLCGFSFLRGKAEGGYLSSSNVPLDGMKETFCECRINRNISGDMAEVWYTHCLREFPFPEFKNEKFLGEDLVWVKLSKKYRMRFFNDVIYISNYLEDGLTKNRRRHNIESPKGCVARAESFLESGVKLRWKIKPMLQYQIYGRFAKIKGEELFAKTSHKVLYYLLYVPSVALYIKWRKKECRVKYEKSRR